MGGRIAALDAVEGKRRLIYVGAAGGGVWKSVNGGTTFKPVFDDYTQSIGAITIDRKDTDVVWVGTGEPWTRNSVSVGTGIYKTTDAGENWEHLGLEDSERISKVLIDPRNSDTVYVCVPGHLWDAHQERGVFKTTNGGQTWEKILYVDDSTGCADLAMDPQEPDRIYASMWQFRRGPDSFSSGGPGSGLYKTTDGGTSWQETRDGLPQGDLGRIAIAVAPSRPSVIYATVEAKDSAMYRSDDLGETWTRTGTTSAVESRPFYFSLVVVDPKDYQRVYKPATRTAISTDGGETFSTLSGRNHPDHHALWISPENSDQLLIGTDGGIYSSNDGGATWNFLQSLPISQFYQVSYDMEDPYNVYGGLQDNGTWYAPSQKAGGVTNQDWRNIGFGDGFHVYVDPRDPNLVYVEWQGGGIMRVNKSTGETKNIKPLPREGDPKYRFNWNAPIHISPTRKDTIYIGSQFLFRSRDRGESWEKLSPDLTTNDPQKQRQAESGGLTIDNSKAENHCTIYSIAESPRDERIIWVGTDDGNVHVTRDAGQTWIDVTSAIPDSSPDKWVTQVEAGQHQDGTAYVTLDGHRTGDKQPYIYRTDDFGATWTSLGADTIEGYALVIREDPVNASLLFLGTEFGLYISIDAGAQWARFKGNLPKVGVRDLRIHPREHDLIIATHGRGIYILDDLTPIRALTPDILALEAVVLATRPNQTRIPAGVQSFVGDDEFVGSNPRAGAQIAFYLKKRHLFGDLKLEVLDQDGNVLSTLPAPNRRGINRVSWSMRKKPPKIPPATTLVPNLYAMFGPQVPEGSYRVRLTKGEKTFDGSISVVADPRATYTAEGKAIQDQTVERLYGMLLRLAFLADSLTDLQKQCRDRVKGSEPTLDKALELLTDDLEDQRKELVATRKGGGISGEEQLRERLGLLYGAVNGFEGRPTDSQVRYADVLDKELNGAERAFDTLLSATLDRMNTQLQASGAAAITRLSRSAWESSAE